MYVFMASNQFFVTDNHDYFLSSRTTGACLDKFSRTLWPNKSRMLLKPYVIIVGLHCAWCLEYMHMHNSMPKHAPLQR